MSFLKPSLRVWRGVRTCTLAGYAGFLQFLRNVRHWNTCEQAKLVLQATIEPSRAHRARQGALLTCLDYCALLHTASNGAACVCWDPSCPRGGLVPERPTPSSLAASLSHRRATSKRRGVLSLLQRVWSMCHACHQSPLLACTIFVGSYADIDRYVCGKCACRSSRSPRPWASPARVPVLGTTPWETTPDWHGFRRNQATSRADVRLSLDVQCSQCRRPHPLGIRPHQAIAFHLPRL